MLHGEKKTMPRGVVFGVIVFFLFVLCGLSHSAGQDNAQRVLPLTGKGTRGNRIQVEIVNAGSMRPLRHEGRMLHRLLGDVVLRHDQAYMRCDSAHVDQVYNTFNAYGHVRIESEEIIIKGDSLYYEGNEGTGRIVGRRVILHDTVENARLYSNQLFFDTQRHNAHYLTWGLILMKQGELRSRRGYYDWESKVASVSHAVSYRGDSIEAYGDSLQYQQQYERLYFYGPTRLYKDTRMGYGGKGWYDERTDQLEISRDAYVSNGSYRLLSDWLYVDDRDKSIDAKGHVLMEDSVGMNRIYTPRLRYWDRADSGRTEGATLLLSLDTIYSNTPGHGLTPLGDSNTTTQWYRLDTTMMFSHYMIVWNTPYTYLDSVDGHVVEQMDTLLQVKTFGEVKVHRNDIQMIADTLYYHGVDSTISLLRTPFPLFWTEDLQAQAQKIVGFMGKETLDSAHLIERVIVGNPDKDTGKYNQLGGGYMRAYFQDGHIEKVHMREDTQLIFFIRDSIDLIGVNRVESPRLQITFEDGSIAGVTFYEKPRSLILPLLDAQKEDKWLFGFSWHYTLRPQYRELLIPTWLKSFDLHSDVRKQVAKYRAVEGLRLVEMARQTASSELDTLAQEEEDDTYIEEPIKRTK